MIIQEDSFVVRSRDKQVHLWREKGLFILTGKASLHSEEQPEQASKRILLILCL